MIRHWPLMALVSGGLFLVCAGSIHAMVVPTSRFDTELPLDAAPPPRHQPWWVGFNDDTMNQLIRAARLHSVSVRPSRPLDAVPLETGVAAAYVSMRALELGLMYLEKERSAIERQLVLMVASQPEHDDFIKELSGRMSTADESIRKTQAQRVILAAFLAAQCGMSQAALADAIAQVHSNSSRAIPRFFSAVPRALPMALLVNRDDVNLAAALYGVDSAALLGGVIETTDELTITTPPDDSEENDGAETVLPGHPLYLAVVAHARKEASEALYRLQARSDIANTAYSRVQRAGAEFDASNRRRDRGEVSEVLLMEDFQTMLQDLRALAVANGELAIAWIALIDRLGSGTSLDGGPALQSAGTRVRPKVSRKPSDP